MQFRKFLRNICGVLIAIPVFNMVWGSNPAQFSYYSDLSGTRTIPIPLTPEDTGKKDTTRLPYPFQDRFTDRYSNDYDDSPLYLDDPENIKSTIEYDPDEKQYNINENMGSMFYRNPSYLTFDEFKNKEFDNSTRKYWRQRSGEDDILLRKGFNPKIYVGSDVFDRIFGGNTIDIRPQGSAELTFGINIQTNENPAIPEKQRTNATFDFKERIQMSVTGNIGEKMKLTVNYNTEASFEFENKMKLEYTGKEDEIIQKIEAGNVSLPLTSSLITGSQSLFGLKTQLKFGRLNVTTVFSQQKGQRSTIDVPPGGGQITNYEILADQYEANKHFFLSQYFKDNYDKALINLPVVSSPFNITRIEVWKTNRNAVNDANRDIVAFMDLGEYNFFATGFIGQGTSVYPSDSLSNDLYFKMTKQSPYNGIRDVNNASSILGTLNAPPANFAAQQDYVVLKNARKLGDNDYTYNARLGYISLNSTLNPDEVLAVAYEYTIGNNVFRVGELTTTGIDPTKTLIVKLIRSKAVSPKLPTWDLMMKNIYALNGYQISRENFKLDVLYADDADGGKKKRFISAGPTEQTVNENPLIKLLGLDKLNSNNDPIPGGDGVFDFVEGVTINTQNGRIIFPVREPFGSYLRTLFNDQTIANKYVYEELYDSTLTIAQQFAQKNKFNITGTYQSSSGAEISLNAINIPQGSVKVTQGGEVLTENMDYTVDYNLGKVKIINAGRLNSNIPIQVSVESQSLFSIQSKTLIGSRFDYEISKDLTFGGTFLHLNERPITQKVNIGDEPISNTIWGLDGTYRTDSRLLTKAVDMLPFLETKEASTVTFSGEFAQFIPGHSKAIGSSGNAYIDDFEGSQSTIDIRNPGNWFLASTPQGQNSFPETQGSFVDSLRYGFNRAKLAWYTIDPTVFYRDNGLLPPNITQDDLSNNNVRPIREKEIFPNKQSANNVDLELSVMNLAYYPGQRGPYNFDVEGAALISAGINTDGTLAAPETRWGGIMRRIESSDFEAANVEFIQFWLMDPFHEESLNSTSGAGGRLYFNLGNISEDIMSDGQQFFENGMPAPTNNFTIDTSSWGRVPRTDYLVDAFDNDPASRDSQDIGLDGLSTPQEQTFFQQSYFDRIANTPGLGTGSPAYSIAQNDPSADDFHYFRGSDYDADALGILDRYKNYNGTEGNSNTDAPEGFTISATTIPDKEDINKDFQTETDENYNQYMVDFVSRDPTLYNYLVDSIHIANPSSPNQNAKPVTWYQFKIPVNKPDELIGLGLNPKSVNFIRMYMQGWSQPVIMRFAKLELLRGEWRRYPFNVVTDLEGDNVDLDNIDITVVNLEENGKRQPIPYVLPPGIEREIAVGTTNQQQLNEQSLALRVCDLNDGDSRAAYKNTQFDVRNYKSIKMYIHAEDRGPSDQLQDRKDVVVFVRFGTDFTANYYEYEVPVKVTRWYTSSDTDIWPTENELNIQIQNMINAKLERNKQQIPFTNRFSVADGTNRITVKGNPSLNNVKSIMIGVRNYAANDNPFSTEDDGLSKCVEVWVNELRMSDFNEQGGWAANARVQAKMADFGSVNVSGARSTYGFGQLESKINERQQDNRTQYDIASSLELGKFFPQKTGISVPMYIGYSKAVARPEYNPLDPDVKFKDALETRQTQAAKDSLKNITEDLTRRKSINFTNVKKNKTGNATKTRIYDVENLNFSYGYSETFRRNVNTEYDIQKDYLGAVGYNFNTNPKGISPFAKTKAFAKSKYAKPIKDFNINFIPSSFSFRTDVTRHYQESKLRNINNDTYSPAPTFDKRFLMARQYSVSWDITRSIKFDFDANNLAKIDEPEGKLDTKEEKEVVRKNFFRGGRNTDYRHTGTLSYNLPLNKLPITDWISVNARYGFDYHWSASSLVFDPLTNEPRINPALGNTIQNTNTKQLNSTLTFTTLYNKIPLFKKLLAPPRPKVKAPPKPKQDTTAVSKDTTGGKKPKPPKEKKEKEISPIVRGIAKVFLSVKNFSLNLSENKGTLLPGFTRTSELLGNNFYNDAAGNSTRAPGFGFVFGEQDPDFKFKAARNGWITPDSTLNNQFTTTLTQNLTARSNIEPFDGFRIELSANRNFAKNHSEYFRTNSLEEFEEFSAIDAGNFSISWLTINTAFSKDNKDYTSDVFKKFDENRLIISRRLAQLNPLSSGLDTSQIYNDGYGATSQEVLTYAFLAAYSGTDANSIGVGFGEKNVFPRIPKPNWRVTYDGLSKLPFAKKLFQSITLSHGYRSTLSINSFSTSLLYKDDRSARDQVGNFIPEFEIQQISISEQFTPLGGIDITWKNKLSTRFEYKRDRTLSLTFAGVQMTEIKGIEYTIGAGYRFKPKFPLKIGGKKITLNNDLNLTADISLRKNSTILRKLQEKIDQPTAGLNVYSVELAADYTVNERFNVRSYFRRRGSTPLISTSFPTTATEFGITIRFTLAQ